MKATIIPEFNTNADGCGFVCLIFFIITKIVIAISGITIKSLIIKKKCESFEKNKIL